MTLDRRSCTLNPFFMDGTSGRLFAVAFEPAGKARGSVLFCPPFAEEMNKSRRLVALTARRLADSGFRVLSVDLYGTGDSAGDFANASWALWRDDLLTGLKWLQKSGDGETAVWGLRLGACLALDLAQSAGIDKAILWQPVISGSVHMTQFLRLKIAAQITQSGRKTSTAELRTASANGEFLEIAGYSLSPELFDAIDCLDLREIDAPCGIDISWFEVVGSDGQEPALLSTKLANGWTEAGVKLDLKVVQGEQFWASQEIGLAPELIDATVACFGD